MRITRPMNPIPDQPMQRVVNFAKRMEMTVVNTFFQMRQEHRLTYKSGGKSRNLKEISEVVVDESVARQHRMVVCRTLTLVVGKMKRTKTKQRRKWWKLKKEECCVVFREELRQALRGQEAPQITGQLQLM